VTFLLQVTFLLHIKYLPEYILFVVQAFLVVMYLVNSPFVLDMIFFMVVPLLLIYFHFNLIIRSYNGMPCWNRNYIGILQIHRCLPADRE
jgi:hypothetical protein